MSPGQAVHPDHAGPGEAVPGRGQGLSVPGGEPLHPQVTPSEAARSTLIMGRLTATSTWLEGLGHLFWEKL